MNFYYWIGYHLSRLAGRLFFRFRVIHRERMIQSGPVILAMNHQSYLDPPLAGTTCDRAIYFLARRTLLDVPLLGWWLLAVVFWGIGGSSRPPDRCGARVG